MPKMKTHKGSRKRFRVTATGKLKRRQAGKKHTLASELIAERTADENEAAQEERIRFEHPLDIGDRRVEIGLQRRERDVDI